MRTRHPRAAGFTLIELLLVISILGLLAALATGTFFRVRAAQQEKTINEILVRFSTGLERLTKATVDQARQDVREDRPVAQPAVRMSQVWAPTAAAPNNQPSDPDRDRAAGLWAYLKLRSELPQTFDEAALGVVGHPVSGTGGVGTFNALPPPLSTGPYLPAKPTYRQLVGFTAVSNTNWTWNQLLRTPNSGGQRDYALEAAALLYQILTERGVRGELAGDEIGGSQVSEVESEYQVCSFNPTTGTFGAAAAQTTRVKVKVFKDVLGGPISFVRHAQNYDIQTTNPNGGPPVDPLDPQRRLRVLGAGGVPNWGDVTPNPNVFRLAFLDAMRYQSVGQGTAFAPAGLPIFPDAINGAQQRWVTTLVAPATERTSATRRKYDALNDCIHKAITGQDPPLPTPPLPFPGPSLIVQLPKDSAYLYSYSAR